MPIEIFDDRREAGRKLAEKLQGYANQPEVLVLGLPRGGVPVAFEVAAALDAPLDVFIVRKIGVPGHPELAMGAIASGGISYLNEEILRRLPISSGAIERVVSAEKAELARRETLFRAGRPPLELKNRIVILVDDGLATGASMLAAVQAVRKMGPKKVVVAVPVMAGASVAEIGREVDDLVYVVAPSRFYAVGQWYSDFGQTSDEEVQQLLGEANASNLENVRRSEWKPTTLSD